jgi:Ca2+-binding EF-hand superfamily protein
MFRRAFMMGALVLAPAVATAQQPCTTDARSVINVVYQHVLERGADNASGALSDRLDPEGMRAYTAILKNQGVSQAIDGLLNSDEYRRNAGDWGVPGSGIRYCAPGTTSSNTPGNTINTNARMRFRGMDRNNDGAISRTEWNGTRESFVVNDWNGDNVLSGEEVAPGAQRNANNNRAVNPARFRDLDVDRDGFIERAEWRDSADAFDWLDRNNDNLLSRAEVAGRTGAAAQPAPAVDPFDELDANNDGRVSLREYRWSRRQFIEQDTNDDGVLTRREFNDTGGVPTSGVR